MAARDTGQGIERNPEASASVIVVQNSLPHEALPNTKTNKPRTSSLSYHGRAAREVFSNGISSTSLGHGRACAHTKQKPLIASAVRRGSILGEREPDSAEYVFPVVMGIVSKLSRTGPRLAEAAGIKNARLRRPSSYLRQPAGQAPGQAFLVHRRAAGTHAGTDDASLFASAG